MYKIQFLLMLLILFSIIRSGGALRPKKGKMGGKRTLKLHDDLRPGMLPCRGVFFC